MSTDNKKDNKDLFEGCCKGYGLKKWSCIDHLLYKLCPENGKQWNLKTLDKYLNIVYTRANKLDINKPFNPDGSAIDGKTYCFNDSNPHYKILNTTLLDKMYEEIYFISEQKQDKKFHPLEDIGFYTNKEIEKLNNTDITDLVKNTKRVYYCEEGDLSYLFEGIRYSDIDFQEDKNKDVVREKRIYEICKSIYNHSKPGVKHKLTDLIKYSDYDYVSNEIKEDYKQYLLKHSFSHLIIDGSDNLPLSLLNSFFNSFQFKDYNKKKYGIQLCIFYADTPFDKGGIEYEIKEGDCFNILGGIIKKAVEDTIKRFKNDNNLIAPIYYVDDNSISYILPLYFSHNMKPDCALLINKENNKYIATTILNMEEAYTDARILGTVDKYQWLNQ